MKKPVGKVKKTQAQIDAELAASKKAYEKYKATRPSKAKLAEMYTEQQNRLRRSKTVAPQPAAPRTPASGTKKNMPKIGGAKPSERRLLPKDTNAAPSPRRLLANTTTKAPAKMTPKPKVTKKPEKMTPQDAAMKKILEKRYGKIYG